MDDQGNTKDDLRLPSDETLAKQIQDMFDEGKELVVTVLKAMDEEAINMAKEAAAGKKRRTPLRYFPQYILPKVFTPSPCFK
eukprot:jgi/Pico_ML_1/53698/g4203.t1